MNYEDLKRKLGELRHKKLLLRQKERMIAEELEMIDGLRGIDFTELRIKGGKFTPIQQQYIEHMEKIVKAYESLMSEIFLIEDYLAEHMPSLSALEQAMVTDKYMNGKSWIKIQEEYGYEAAQPFRIVRGALKKLSDSMKHDSK